MKDIEVKAILFDEVGSEASESTGFKSLKSLDRQYYESMVFASIDPNRSAVIGNHFIPKLSPWHQTQIHFNSTQEKKLEENHRTMIHIISNCPNEDIESVHSMIRTNTMKRQCGEDATSEETSAFDLMFSYSRISQILATPGGRLCAWNNAFVMMIGLSPLKSLAAMTIFDLVSASELPKLHQIFVVALYEEFSEKSDRDEDLYISLSVPCIHFGPCTQQMFITVSLMYDPDPCKRCFHCIISPKSIGEIGKIMYIHQNELTSQLIQ